MEIRILDKISIKISRILSSEYLKNNDFKVPADCIPGKRYDTIEKFFIHIHIPKTAGTTFNTILEKNFKESYEPFTGRFIHLYPKLTSSQIKHYISKHHGIRCVTSHNFNAILPYQSADREIVALAFVRDPIDTFFSYYFHMRNRFGVSCIEKELPLLEYIEQKERGIKNIKGKSLPSFLRHFTGVENDAAYEYVRRLVEQNNLFIFPTNEMTSSMEFLKRKFPEDFTDVSFNRENVSKKDQEVTEDMKDRIKKIVSDYDWKLLTLANQTLKCNG